MRRQRRDSCGAQRKEEQPDAVGVLAEGQRVARRKEIVGVKEREPVPRSVPVPIEDPGVDEWIARIGGGTANRREE